MPFDESKIKRDSGRLEFFKDKKVAIVAPELRGGYLTYLFTAYKTRKAPS